MSRVYVHGTFLQLRTFSSHLQYQPEVVRTFFIAYGGLELDMFDISSFCEQNNGHPPENLAAI